MSLHLFRQFRLRRRSNLFLRNRLTPLEKVDATSNCRFRDGGNTTNPNPIPNQN